MGAGETAVESDRLRERIPRGEGMISLGSGCDGLPEPEDESLLRWLCSRRIFKDI